MKTKFNHDRPRRFFIGLIFRVLQSYFATLKFFRALRTSSVSHSDCSLVAIEAGERGWDLIEYKELYASATEYLDENTVCKIVIRDSENYFSQVKAQISKLPVTHYFYDPRSGPQTFFAGTLSALRLSNHLFKRKIIPIVRLTDVPHKFWRYLSMIINASGGICITLMFPGDIQHLFPHKRIFGPFMMPMSNETYRKMKLTLGQSERKSTTNSVQFIGSLYEPRTTFLKDLDSLLSSDMIELRMRSRVLGEQRINDDDYWAALADAAINITTSDQITGKGIDNVRIPHMVYRYTEVLCAGSTLVATSAPGVWKYFRANIDYAPFANVEEAHDQIKKLIKYPDRLSSVALSGHSRVGNLIESSTFWRSIDLILGIQGFSKLE